MKKITIITTIFLCMTTMTMAKKSKTVTLKFIETSDVHGAFFPYDFIERTPMKGSMARVSTYIKKQRKEYGDNLILLENGDILQGQPTCYYTNYVKTDLPNVAAEVVNYMGYDAQVVGNHDVETGHKVYDKWISELKCPTLGSNIIDTKTNKPYVKPYIIIERDGVKVAILGMLTPAIPNWLHENLWKGLRFEEMVANAKKWVEHLKKEEKPDAIIGLLHSGWDGGIATMHYDEDATKKVAEQVEGFDVIFFGHDHTQRDTTLANGVLCLDPSCNALSVAEATITFKNGKITEKKGKVVNITGEDIDQDFVKHFQSQMDSISSYVGKKIGDFTTPIRSRDAFFGSAPFTDYIHELQLEETKADISLNAPLVFDTEIKAGPVYMSDMFKLYRYENQIYVLKLTGKEIKDMLEMSYDQWVNTMKSPDDHVMLLTDQSWNDKQRMGFKYLTFNFDSAAGIDYVVDVTKPDGQKVIIKQFSDGRPFKEGEWYRVAMNSYRGNGGGEFLTKGAGIPKEEISSRIEWMSERDQRYYLQRKIEREGTATPKALNNWKFVPEEWTKPAIERDRKLIFNK